MNLMEPKLFNVIIMALYVINAVWWGWHGRWVDTAYWLSSFAITAVVTWGYAR